MHLCELFLRILESLGATINFRKIGHGLTKKAVFSTLSDWNTIFIELSVPTCKTFLHFLEVRKKNAGPKGLLYF